MDETPETAEHPVALWIRRNSNWLILGLVFLLIVLPRISPWDGLNNNLNFFARFSEWVLRHLERLFKDYGYYVVFFGVLLENSMFLGLLVPGAIILILAGLSAENGAINIWLVFGLAISATIIGDTISYMIGRLGWTKAFERMGVDKMIEKVREPMLSNSTWIILAYHLAGYSRVIGPAAAGIFRIPFRRWALLDYTGGTIWVLLYTMAGVILGLAGVQFGDTKRMVQLLEFFFLGLLVVAVVVAVARSAAKARGDGPGAGGGRVGRRPSVVPADERE